MMISPMISSASKKAVSVSLEKIFRMASIAADAPFALLFDDRMSPSVQREIRDLRTVGSRDRAFAGDSPTVLAFFSDRAGEILQF